MISRRDKPYGRRLKGIDAFIGVPSSSNSLGQFLPIDKIELPSQQPRRYFDPNKLEQLIASVKEHGILEPLLVRLLPNQQYELVAGERRYRAAQALGLREVPVVVKELSDWEALQLALVENLQREDLNPVEETEGILQLIALKLNVDSSTVVSWLYRLQNAAAGKITDNVISNSEREAVERIFRELGKMSWESFTANRLPLLKLPSDILEALRQGKLAYTKAKAISQIKDSQKRTELLNEVLSNSLSLSQIRERVKVFKSIPPNAQKNEELLSLFQATYKRAKESKKFLADSKKRKKIESLLRQIEKLIAEEEDRAKVLEH